MQQDVVELRDFYQSPLGHVVRRTLQVHIRRRWASAKGETLVGVGFATPFLTGLRAGAGVRGGVDAGGAGRACMAA